MKKVIINADDSGCSSTVNLRIIKSYKEGILTPTTLMTDMPGRDEAIILTRENLGLGVGGHLVLTCGKPLAEGTSFIDGDGDFYSLAEYKKCRSEMCDEEIFQKWSHQINHSMDHGLQLTHLDSHHRVHPFPENLEVTKGVVEKCHLCFRNVFGLEESIELSNRKKVKSFLNLVNHSAIRDLAIPFRENRARCFGEVQTVFDQVADNEIAELTIHPAYTDEILYFNPSFNIQRMKEVSVLCDSQVKQFSEENQVMTCSYRNV